MTANSANSASFLISPHRRQFLRGATAAGLSLTAGTAWPEDDAISRLTTIEQRIGGRVGILAVNLANGRMVAHRADERFAMCSTFKWLLAAAILEQVDAGKLTLADRLQFSDRDILPYAPSAKRHLSRGFMTIAQACEAAVTLSDNTAANLLLARLGGTAALTQTLRKWGDAATRLDRIEPALNENALGDERDTTTPKAMAFLMKDVLAGSGILVPSSRERLASWLIASRTGQSKLRAGLPVDWTAGDKSGLGGHGANNDIAIIWPSTASPPLIIASYLSGSAQNPAMLDPVHAEIARIALTRTMTSL